MEFHALVEEWPNECIVTFRELPGCFAKAATAEQAIQQAPETIAAYLQWLKQNDIFFFEDEITSIEVVLGEQLRTDRVGPRFEADLPAPTDQEIDNALNVAATARAQLIDLYDAAPADLRGREPRPGVGSLTQHLQNVLLGEVRYIACLSDQPQSAIPAIAEEDLLRTFVENAMDYETLLRDLTPEQRTHVYTHGGEEWTAAKVLRRLTRYLREYYPWMQGLARQLSTLS
ncbi:type II toxin-antitoxin system HicB family antitoxin [Dictyobacter kobayashii]|uniref:Uncharacterized protein n=1 Tax=Dictyobacter kobayashii TaxID=2014872 RepID=A0A402APP9_9CHLR|nr:hypothetical protein [Dictyobacter kobayashii]GCE21034.1 hypothetical protein KDK_48340 [Dictyobacter kobayashii]